MFSARRRVAIAAICAPWALIGGSSVGEARDRATPNIVIILADDLGSRDVSVYDSGTVSPTPRIDQLAEEGIQFLDAHSPASVCTPSRYALLTGRYAWRTRLKRGVLSIFSEPLIDSARTTLPEMLQSRGYRTAAIGKWHLGMNVAAQDGGGFVRTVDKQMPTGVDFGSAIQGGPLDHGFESYFGAQLRRVRGYVRDRHFVGAPKANELNTTFSVDGWDSTQRGASHLAAALDFIDECHSTTPNKPFFLYFATHLPHGPYSPPDSLASVAISGTSPAGPRADSIKELDVIVGELVSRIDELGIAENTLIIVTSDNGAVAPGVAAGDTGRMTEPRGARGAKGGIMEAAHSVPFVARWGDGTREASTIRPGTVSRDLIGLQDIMATLADVVSAPLGDRAAEDSESFLATLLGRQNNRPSRTDFVFQAGDGQFAIRQANWKFVVDLDSVAVGPDATAPLLDSGQLFDLRSDPGEFIDRRGDYPTMVRVLLDTLNQHRRSGRSATRAQSRQSSVTTANPTRSDSDGTGEGRWREIRTPVDPGALSEAQREQLEKLEAIGYLGGVTEVNRAGVTFYDPDTAQQGANFFSSGHAEEAVLMDMEGEVLHRWTASFNEIWPDSELQGRVGSTWWRRAHLFDNGDVLAVYEGAGIAKLDKYSNVIWATHNNVHHDLEVLANGDIVVLTRTPRVIPELHESKLTLEDFVVVLDSDGNEKRRVSVWECFRNSEFMSALQGGRKATGDIFHTNSIHVLDGTLEEQLPEFRKGDILTSLNAMGVLAVVSLEEKTIRWVQKGLPTGQHDPSVLENGNVLVFDNRRTSNLSSVMEFDAVSGELVWEFRGTEHLPFHSKTCGAAHRLSNGNTLITESDGGRALEVTPDGVIAWEFYNPERSGDEQQYIATLSDVERVAWEEVEAWLD